MADTTLTPSEKKAKYEEFNNKYSKANIEVILGQINTGDQNELQQMINAFPPKSNKIYLILNKNIETNVFDQILLYDNVEGSTNDSSGNRLTIFTSLANDIAEGLRNQLPNLNDNLSSIHTLLTEIKDYFVKHESMIANEIEDKNEELGVVSQQIKRTVENWNNVINPNGVSPELNQSSSSSESYSSSSALAPSISLPDGED